MRILLATCEEYPDLGVSARVYREALCRAGATVEAVVWTRGVEPFIGADLVVIRATWDYHRNLDGYRAWLRGLEAAAVPVANPVPLILWNLDKSYLDELALHGIATPAQLVVPCEPTAAREAMQQRGWTRAVAKPLAGASGHGVELLALDSFERSWPAVARAVTPHRLLLQEFIAEIRSEGQVSYVFIDRELTHAVRSLPTAGEFRINSTFTPQVEVIYPRPADIDEARRVLEVLPMTSLYARIDMVRRGDRQTVLEAEVNEPGLFFQHAPRSADIFARATLAWAARMRAQR